MNDVIAYHAPSIHHGTALLDSASAALMEAQNDLLNVNTMLADHMHGQFHAAYREAMMRIESGLQHLAETVGVHSNVTKSITDDAIALDGSLGAG